MTWNNTRLAAIGLALGAIVTGLCVAYVTFYFWSEWEEIGLTLRRTVTISSDKDTVYHVYVDKEGNHSIVANSLRNWRPKSRLVVGNAANPQLSGDSRYLYFDRHSGNGLEVWRLELSTGNMQLQFGGKGVDYTVLHVNESGSRVIVLRYRHGSQSIFAMALNTERLTLEVLDNKDDRHPQPSPMLDVGNCFIWRWNPEQTRENTLHSIPNTISAVASSDDGRRVLFCTQDKGLKVFDFEQEETIPVTRRFSTANITPSGNYVIYRNYNGEVWSLQLDTRMRKSLSVVGYTERLDNTPGGIGCFAGNIVLVFDEKRNILVSQPINPPK